MRGVLYIANSEGLKCEEYKFMKNERYLSDVPEKLSTAIQLASKRFVISDVPDCPFICGQPPLILVHQPESAFCSAKVSEFHDAFFPLIISPTLPLSPKEVLIHFYYLSIRISISRANTTN